MPEVDTQAQAHPRTFLHIGCGPKRKDRTTRGFNTDDWIERRLDIDESVQPDLIGTMTDMSAGPIAPLDILYGHRPAMARGNLYMAHRCGFTQKVLDGTLRHCGFQSTASLARSRAPFFDLWVVASKSPRTEAELRTLAAAHFPT